MAARSRPRTSHAKEDLGDEVHLWNTIVDKIKRCNAINKRYDEIAKGIPPMEDLLADENGEYCIRERLLHYKSALQLLCRP
jgi:hypothetical protein